MPRALIVIDIQNDYFPGGLLPLFQAPETEERIVAAIAAARHAGDRVILVQHVSQGAGGLFDAAGAGVQIRPAILAAAGNAPVVVKHRPGQSRQTGIHHSSYHIVRRRLLPHLAETFTETVGCILLHQRLVDAVCGSGDGVL